MGLRTPSSLEMTPALRSHLDDRALRAQAAGGICRQGAPAGTGDRRSGDDRRNDVGLDRRLEGNDRRIPDNDRRRATEPFPGEDRRQDDRREPDADRRNDPERRTLGTDRREREPADEPGQLASHRPNPLGRGAERPADLTGNGTDEDGSPSNPPAMNAKTVRADKTPAAPSREVAQPKAARDDQGPLLVGEPVNGPTDANGQTALVTGSRSEPSESGRTRAVEWGKDRVAEGGAVLLTGAMAMGFLTPDTPDGDTQARTQRADESGHVVRAPVEPSVELQDAVNEGGEIAEAIAEAVKMRREVEDALEEGARREVQPGKAGEEHQPDHRP
jgi:hypothetical protein